MAKVRIGIVGYGNLGRATEEALRVAEDLQLVAIFSRRPAVDIHPVDASVPVYSLDDITRFRGQIDVLILCGGSKDDLPVQGPALAAQFNTVDSFDTHALIPEYFTAMQAATHQHHTVAMSSIGWDPGLFSLARLLGEAILPQGDTYTFWGKGLSQGHSDAIRRVPGVKAGVQYTVPSMEAIERVRRGERPQLTTKDKHQRECFVVLESGADAAAVEAAIVSMPHYFSDYTTTVNFISEDTLKREHDSMAHGGFVFRSGQVTEGVAHTMEFSLTLESNPAFTACVLVAYARAAYRLHQRGDSGVYSILDVAPCLLSPLSPEELRRTLL